MKKRLVYLVILIGILFVGLTSFYLARNIETIALTIAENEVIQLNTGDEYALPFVHNNPAKDTVTTVEVVDGELVAYDAELQVFTASLTKGGSTIVNVKTNNKKLPTFSFSIRVGNGSVQNPFVVKTAVELKRIGVDAKWTVTSSYILDSDLDLSVLEGNWTPIGTETIPFTGLFDGNFKTISNLTIADGAADYAGLFGVITGSGKVEFLKMKNVNISGTFVAAGAVAGLVKGAIVSKTEVWNERTDISLTNTTGVVGGVVGTAILFNDIKPAVFTCSSKNMVLNGATVGGVLASGTGAIVFDCFAANNFISSEAVQPIIGGVIGTMNSALNSLSIVKNDVIKNSYSSSVLQGEIADQTFVGGVVGRHSGSEQFIIGNFYLAEKGFTKAVGNIASISAFCATAITSEQMQTQSTYVSFEGNTPPAEATGLVAWNFDSVWVIDGVFPTLNYESESSRPYVYELGDMITTAEQLIAIALFPNNDYVIANDITLTTPWVPIPLFNGTLSGKSLDSDTIYKIKNLSLSSSTNNAFVENMGASARISDLVFENVTLTNGTNMAVVANTNNGIISNVEINGLTATNPSGTGTMFGSIASINSGKIINSKLEPSNTITLSNMSFVGGVVASNFGSIESCSVSAQIVMSNPDNDITYGGIVAVQNRATAQIINAIFSIGKLEASSNRVVTGGGLVGINTLGAIKNSYISAHNLAETTNAESVNGGIVGILNGGTLEACYAYGDVSATNVGGIVGKTFSSFSKCYFNGSITGKFAGGLSSIIKGNIRVENSYAVGSVTGTEASGVIAGFAPYVENKAVVEHCFMSVSISGFGDKWQETKSAIGLVDNPFWTNPAGYIRNSVFNTDLVSNSQDQTRFLLWPPFTREGTNQFSGTNAIVCRGEIGSFGVFKSSAKYDSSIWRFVEGFFPELYACEFGEIVQPSQFVEEEYIDEEIFG